VFTVVQSIVQAPTQKLVIELQNVFHFRRTKRSQGRVGGGVEGQWLCNVIEVTANRSMFLYGNYYEQTDNRNKGNTKELGNCIAKFRKTENDKTHRTCREEITLLQSEGKFNNA
jgi:hypothetical protein